MIEDSADWEFLVEDSFSIPKRGVGVIGELTGEIPPVSGAILHVKGRTTVIPHFSVESLTTGKESRLALFLPGLTEDEVPPGSVLKGP